MVHLRRRGESSGNPNGAEQELPPLEPEKEEITCDDIMVSDYDMEQIEDSLMEGNEHSANNDRMPVPVRFNNGNMSRELGATAEQEDEQHDSDNFFKEVQSGAEVIADRNSIDATREQEANNM